MRIEKILCIFGDGDWGHTLQYLCLIGKTANEERFIEFRFNIKNYSNKNKSYLGSGINDVPFVKGDQASMSSISLAVTIGLQFL